MNRHGAILLDRNIRDWPHWNRKPFSPGQAWIDLLLCAAYRPHKVEFGGRVLHLERGQLVTSQRILAAAWGWSTKRVRRVVHAWSETDAIRVVKGNRSGTVITICNYADYQRFPNREGTGDGTSQEPVRNQSGTGEEPRENERNEGNSRRQPWKPLHDYAADWNAVAEQRGWSTLKKLTGPRREKLKARETESIWDWSLILEELEQVSQSWISDFPGWSFDWLILNEHNYVKLIEGKYRDRDADRKVVSIGDLVCS